MMELLPISDTCGRRGTLSHPEFRGDGFDWFPTFCDGALSGTYRLA